MQSKTPYLSYGDVQVKPVTTKTDLKTFINLPWQLYKDMPGYTPSFYMEQETLLDPSQSAVFKHANIEYFIAWKNNKPIGRIAVIEDHKAIEYWDEKIGEFGVLDAIPEEDIVKALLMVPEKWFKEKDIHHIRGPVSLSGNGETGTMIKGQKEEAMIAIPWHPPELDSLIQKAGYKPCMDLLSYRLDVSPDLLKKFKVPVGLEIGTGRLKGFNIKKLSKKEILTQGEIIRNLYNDAWAKKYNFVPMQQYEMTSLIKHIKPLLKKEHYVQIDKNGVPVAMAMILPNLNDITKDLNGKPSLWGWCRFLWRLIFHKFNSARVILLGVKSNLRGTILGAMLPPLAIVELMKRGQKLPYSWVELGWVLENDTGMRNLAESLSPEAYKKHRLYEKFFK